MKTTLLLLAYSFTLAAWFVLGYIVRGRLNGKRLVVYHARKPVSLWSGATDYDNARRIAFFIRKWGWHLRLRLEDQK